MHSAVNSQGRYCRPNWSLQTDSTRGKRSLSFYVIAGVVITVVIFMVEFLIIRNFNEVVYF